MIGLKSLPRLFVLAGGLEPTTVPSYTITFLDAEGRADKRLTVDYACDDDAIDATGESNHPYAIEILDGERLVARFPPQPTIREL